MLKFANRTGNDVIFDANALQRRNGGKRWRSDNFRLLLRSRSSRKYARLLNFELGNGEQTTDTQECNI